ncbi:MULTISPECIES: carbohydrate ABC transporter permease [Glutamicibacter]|uniref:Sugar ABC transporter permease n=1 Tax=Glutamicibacter halophytocola TaxID=1933880 RepID=A0A5B8IRI6_9MICC|nr:sugar ABC transporter permease [Glutamicibacter halophytocola]MBF6673044.1 sugar ABC transporter permease [Glutamicibacter sp. FBE19]NQD42765.1 sugar ABC transporter permease [Glutamicibacter halophytocola]QDY66968.1 sugar ABC transporter permease [Glutamicibacter halophytocola]UUX59114.1 sugar ABC transporter permease [Glutamicibacter halophytocola]
MSAIAELQNLSKAKGRKAPAKDNKAAHIFLIPWTIGLFLVTLGPMAMSLYLAFTDYNLLQSPEFTGFDNIQRMLEDQRLHNSLRVTFIYVLVGVPLQLAVALGVAILLDRGMRGLSFYRSVFYLPSMLGSSVAIAVLWKQIFGTTGLVNQMLDLVGIQGIGWISDPNTSLGSLILLNVWTFGSPMVIFLAGLRQVPAMYYEAASIDGATKWRQFRSITLPMISPIIFFNLVLQIIGAFQNFTQAFIVSNGSGGPADSTMFFTLYLYQQGFKQFDMGYASAMAWLLVLIVGAFTAVNFFVSKYWVFYDD